MTFSERGSKDEKRINKKKFEEAVSVVRGSFIACHDF